MREATIRVFRGERGEGAFQEYKIEIDEGMVVLDAVLLAQARRQPDLAVRWNCKAGKCGSCSAEMNGRPGLMCMKRMSDFAPGETVTVQPMRTFPHVKDLVADVSWNYEVNKKIPPFRMRKERDRTMYQEDADRVQEFRKCIECFLCQDVCHVLREHGNHERFGGPRFFVRAAALEMHPWDEEDRVSLLKESLGIGLCNITKCCTEVCPENITITDNAIIPLKERVVNDAYDPVAKMINKMTGRSKPQAK
ncbi:MAG: succinate dehydrogenase/fumarate reductase iron-sulfur subunit [Planctomycetota bacterium]